MTIDFVDSEIEFFKEKKQLSQVLLESVDLAQNPFKDDFNLFIAFEFDRIYSEMFYGGLLRFLNDINDGEFTFYTLNPIPDKYFFENFSKYSIGKIPISAAFTDYMDFLDRDPGNSPADALLYNAETIAIYSNKSVWGFIGSKDLEIGIIGFNSAEIKNKFISHFENSYFTTLEDRINEIIFS